MFTTTFLSYVLLAIAVTADPIVVRENFIRLPFAKQVNLTSASNVLKADQARAAGLRTLRQAKPSGSLTKDAVVNVGVQNQAVHYVASVGIGSPATTYSLIIDTGSSNTWVGASKPYVMTSTSKVNGKSPFLLSYFPSGQMQGFEFSDQVSLGPGLIIANQSLGVAFQTQGFAGVDGVLGLGPVEFSNLPSDPNTPIPTVTDNLFSQGSITQNEFAIYFEPTTQAIANNGELTFGGTDSSKFTGGITFTPSTEQWDIEQSIRYGASNTILSTAIGMVDTGTNLILIASDAFSKYTTATGAVLDSNTGLLRLTAAQFNNLKSLFFIISGREFELTANAQAWPRSLNTLIGGTSGNIYLIVASTGWQSGSGTDFFNGIAFLERFYSVFDTTNKRVGFATTRFTKAITN